jgi:hypothetical protein
MQTTILMPPRHVSDALLVHKRAALQVQHMCRQVPQIYQTLDLQGRDSTCVTVLLVLAPTPTLNV